MRALQFILRLLGWLVTILLQIAVALLIIFLFSVIFAGVDTFSRLGWLALLFFIWLGYVLGISLVGLGSLRWVWKDASPQARRRVWGTMLGALIPLLILLPIGYSLPVGSQGSRFYDLVSNTWQPILAQVALFAAVLGFYLPGAFKPKRA